MLCQAMEMAVAVAGSGSAVPDTALLVFFVKTRVPNVSNRRISQAEHSQHKRMTGSIQHKVPHCHSNVLDCHVEVEGHAMCRIWDVS